MTTREFARAICLLIARHRDRSTCAISHELLAMLREKTSIPEATLAMWPEGGEP